MIWCRFSFYHLDPLCDTLNTIILIVIDRLDRSPAAFLILRLILNGRQAVLDVGTLVLVGDKNTVVGSCDDKILRSHDYHWDTKSVDRMAVLTCTVPGHVPDTVLTHLFCQGVPGS